MKPNNEPERDAEHEERVAKLTDRLRAIALTSLVHAQSAPFEDRLSALIA